MITTDAWLLRKGVKGLSREQITFPEPGPGDVLVEPVYGSWEGNMSHAVDADPIDLCEMRDEEQIVIGNSAVLRVLKSRDPNIKEGDLGLMGPHHTDMDRAGYIYGAPGYDAPNSMGVLVQRIVMSSVRFMPLPKPSQFSIRQWASFGIRFTTAWSNWRVALGAYRLQVPVEVDPHPYVWGWGGGTTTALLDLARRQGCRVTQIVGNEGSAAYCRSLGIDVVDRSQFKNLNYDEKLFAKNPEARAAYMEAERQFMDCVDERTQKQRVAIFSDFIGGPVARASMQALGREGVLTTAGWKKGMKSTTMRGIACKNRQLHVHTHYASRSEIFEAVLYAEKTGWIPPEPDHIYAFADIPMLASDFAKGTMQTYFPVFQIN